MTVFLLGKAWLFAVTVGLILMFVKRSRFASAHLLLGSTFGMVASFAAAALMTLLFSASAGGSQVVVAMVVGSILGALIGSRLAFTLNRYLALQGQDEGPHDLWSQARHALKQRLQKTT